MQFLTFNDFSTETAEAITDVATSILLPAGIAAAIEADRASEGATYVALTATDGADPETVEILYATGISGDSITVIRGREGTTAIAWASGTALEARATAGMLNYHPPKFDPMTPFPNGTDQNVFYGLGDGGVGAVTDLAAWQAYSAWSIVIGANMEDPGDLPQVNAYALGTRNLVESVVIGHTSEGTAGGSLVSIGYYRADVGIESVFVGAYGGNYIDTTDGFVPEGITVVGSQASCGSGMSTIVGWGLYMPKDATDRCVSAVGAGGYLFNAVRTASLGAYVQVNCDEGVAIGGSYDITAERTEVSADRGITIGAGSRVTGAGAEAVSLGYRARTAIPGAFRLAAVPYMPAASEAGTFTAPAVCRQTTEQVAMATPVIDLTNVAATVEFALPAGVTLFPDSIDVVITGSTGATNSASVNVGTASGSPATLVSAGALSSAALASRTVFEALSKDGITSVYVSLGAANTGTTSTAKIVVRGYVMEL